MAQKLKKRDIAAFIINLFIFVSELIVIINKFPTADGSEFRYYTFLSNLMGMAAAVIFMLSAFTGFRKLIRAKSILRFYATCMLTFTFIVVVAVLTPMAMSVQMDPEFLYAEDGAFFQHVAHPLLSMISFIFLEDNRALSKKQPLYMLLLTFLYTVILIILNILRIVTDGPYPFFQVYVFPVWFIIAWIVGLAGFNYLMNYLIYRAGTRKNRITSRR